MSGNVVARKRRWPWAILSLLFAVALAWSFAVTADGRIILQVGMAAGLVLSLLRLTLTSRSSRRVRRAQEADEGTKSEADESQPAPDGRAPSYEEVFGTQVEFDPEGLPEEAEWSRTGGAEVEAEAQWSAEQPPEEPTTTPEEDPQPVPADLQEAVDQVEPSGDGDAFDGDEFQEHLRQMREEFRARAEEAALRVKQREAELHEASVADQER